MKVLSTATKRLTLPTFLPEHLMDRERFHTNSRKEMYKVIQKRVMEGRCLHCGVEVEPTRYCTEFCELDLMFAFKDEDNS